MDEKVSITVDSARRIVFMLVTAAADDRDFLDALRKLLQSGGWEPDFDVVADLRAVSTNALTIEGMSGAASLARVMRERLGPDDPRPRTGILVGSDVAFGLARQYAQLAHDLRVEIRVFRDAGEGCEWLGLREADLPGA